MQKKDVIGHISFFTDSPKTISARSTQISQLCVLRLSDFLEVINGFPEEKEKYCALRDTLSLYERSYGIRCLSCNRFNHSIINCPRLHLQLPKSLYMSRQHREERFEQVERVPFERRPLKYSKIFDLMLQEASCKSLECGQSALSQRLTEKRAKNKKFKSLRLVSVLIGLSESEVIQSIIEDLGQSLQQQNSLENEQYWIARTVHERNRLTGTNSTATGQSNRLVTNSLNGKNSDCPAPPVVSAE